jgi:hypothetical protein
MDFAEIGWGGLDWIGPLENYRVTTQFVASGLVLGSTEFSVWTHEEAWGGMGSEGNHFSKLVASVWRL